MLIFLISLVLLFTFKWPSWRWHNHDAMKQGQHRVRNPQAAQGGEQCPCGTAWHQETRLEQLPKVLHLHQLFHTWKEPHWHQHRNLGTWLHCLLCFLFHSSCKAAELPVSHSAARAPDLGDYCSWRHRLNYEYNHLLLKFNPWWAGFTEFHVWLWE